MRKLLAAALCLAATTTATGCGASVEPTGGAETNAVTLTNRDRKVTYDKVFERPRRPRRPGIPSYILTESCRNGRTKTSRGIMLVCLHAST